MLVKFITSIFIRLLYGKMQRWTGTGTGGKAGIGVRRAVVLRFLASCPHREIQIFMDLILAPFKHLCTGTCLECGKIRLTIILFQIFKPVLKNSLLLGSLLRFVEFIFYLFKGQQPLYLYRVHCICCSSIFYLLQMLFPHVLVYGNI